MIYMTADGAAREIPRGAAPGFWARKVISAERGRGGDGERGGAEDKERTLIVNECQFSSRDSSARTRAPSPTRPFRDVA